MVRLKAALLFWKKLTATLEGWGFIVSPYNQCVANKMTNGKQCTILWHADDLKISHAEASVVSDIIKLIKGKFGCEAPLTKTQRKCHDYLGMTLDQELPELIFVATSKQHLTKPHLIWKERQKLQQLFVCSQLMTLIPTN
jgi:hypothetical protein